MKYLSGNLFAVVAGIAAMVLSANANATIVRGGISFDDNAFADEVIDYSAGINFERQQSGPFDRVSATPEEALLGADLSTSTIDMQSDESLTVGFSDNVVVNGAGADLAIFELFGFNEFGEVTINGVTSGVVGVSLGSIAIPGTGFNNTVNVAQIDLSDFGIAAGGMISSLQVAITGATSEYAAFGAMNSAPVPEAGALMMLGMGLLGFTLVARRRQR